MVGTEKEKERYIATLRLTYAVETALDAQMVGIEATELLSNKLLEDGDTCDITQIIPMSLENVTPEEMVQQLRRSVDLLIKTKIVQCVDLARELHKTAWILEHRREDNFDVSGYDYGSFNDRIEEILGSPRRAHD